MRLSAHTLCLPGLRAGAPLRLCRALCGAIAACDIYLTSRVCRESISYTVATYPCTSVLTCDYVDCHPDSFRCSSNQTGYVTVTSSVY